MKAIWSSKTFWMTLLAAVGLAGVLGWQRRPILAWYHVRQLTYAYQENRADCAKRVAALEEAVLPRLLDGLRDEDAIVCGNMQAALGMIAERWQASDPRCQDLIEKVRAAYVGFSPAGQEKTLLFLTAFLQKDSAKPLPAVLSKRIGELLVAAEKTNSLRLAALLLAAELLECAPAGQWIDECRTMAERGLTDEISGTRIAAVQLLRREPMRRDKELLAKVIPLLHDTEAAVRRAALLALASELDIVREDTLIPLLHDDDMEVQTLCELALRKRNRTDDDIALARLISDKNPFSRMRVLDYLPRRSDLNLAEWLQQLTQDPDPAVRAAAVRAAGETPSVNLSQRLQEMAREDPSESVRLNAQYYLRHRATLRAAND